MSISRYLNGSRELNWEEIIFQRGNEILDSEVNLIQKFQVERLKDVIKFVLRMDSGFLIQNNFSNPGTYSFYMGFNSTDIHRVLLNGQILEVAGTNATNDYQNRIVLSAPHPTLSRTDFVWLEMWVSEIEPNKNIGDGISKPTVDTIYKWGNILYGGANIVDEIEDQAFGKKTTNRAQIQYEIRVAEDVTDFTSANVKAKDGVNQFYPATDPISGQTLQGLWIAQNTNFTYGRREYDENNNPLSYGYHYAIPIARVTRQPAETIIDLNNITDLRETIGLTGLDPNLIYTMLGLNIVNNVGDAIININSIPGSPRIIFKRNNIVVGTLEAQATDRVAFGDQTETEFLYIDTADKRLSLGTINPTSLLHLKETVAQDLLRLENNGTGLALKLETTNPSTITSQGVIIDNTSGVSKLNIFDIQETSISNLLIGSDGLIQTNGGLTAISGNLPIYADALNELRFGLGGGKDIVFYDKNNVEIARWDDDNQELQLGKNSTDVTIGGGFGFSGITLYPNGNIYTDGEIKLINLRGLISSQSNVASANGYIYLGYDTSIYDNYLAWIDGNNRFEFNKNVFIDNTLRVQNVETNNLIQFTGLAGGTITVNSKLNITGFTGTKLEINAHASDSSNYMIHVKKSDTSNAFWVNEIGDAYFAGDVTIDGTTTTVNNNQTVQDTLTVNGDTQLGDSSSPYEDSITIYGTLSQVGADAVFQTDLLYLDNTTQTVNIKKSSGFLTPATNSDIRLVVAGTIGSLYDASNNLIPRIAVGESFANASYTGGNISWDAVVNRLNINSLNAGVNGEILLTGSLVGINSDGTTPVERFDIYGNLALTNRSGDTADFLIRLIDNNDPNNNEFRMIYDISTAQFKMGKLSGGVFPATPPFTFDALGRLGINVNPSEALDVVGNATISNKLRIKGTASPVQDLNVDGNVNIHSSLLVGTGSDGIATDPIQSKGNIRLGVGGTDSADLLFSGSGTHNIGSLSGERVDTLYMSSIIDYSAELQIQHNTVLVGGFDVNNNFSMGVFPADNAGYGTTIDVYGSTPKIQVRDGSTKVIMSVSGSIGRVGTITTSGLNLITNNTNAVQIDTSQRTGFGMVPNVTDRVSISGNASITDGLNVNASGADTGQIKIISANALTNSEGSVDISNIKTDGTVRMGVRSIVSGSGVASNYGLYGSASTANTVYGIYGTATSTGGGTGYGIYGTVSGAGTNWAGYFNGNVNVINSLYIGGVQKDANWDTAYSHSQITSGNPHSVTLTQLGIPNVVNINVQNSWSQNNSQYIATDEIRALDSDGLDLADSAGNVGINVKPGGDVDITGDLDVSRAISGWGIIPIGGIIPWHKNFGGTPLLPNGWLECNGQVVTDTDSPYYTQTLPNLNSTNLFLRGNSTSGTSGGNLQHSHTYDGSTDGAQAYTGGVEMNYTLATRIFHNHDYSGTTDNTTVEPPYFNIVWIIRIK